MVSTNTVSEVLGDSCPRCGVAIDDKLTMACPFCPAEPESLELHLEPDDPPRFHQQREGAFTFIADGRELLRIDPDGTVYREGREIGTDEDVFRALQKWARAALGGQ